MSTLPCMLPKFASAKMSMFQNIFVPKYSSAVMIPCQNVSTPKYPGAKKSPCQSSHGDRISMCWNVHGAEKSPFQNVPVVKHLYWNIEMSDAKISPSKLHTVFFFLDIRNYWWYDECLRGYPQFSNGECPNVWSSRRSGCIHSIDYESLFANDHCKWDTSRYTNSLNNTNLSKTSF